MENIIKKKYVIPVLCFFLIILIVVLYLAFFNKEELVVPEKIEIACNSYFLSEENNSIECNVLSFPKESNNEFIWETDSDKVSITGNFITLKSLDIPDSTYVNLKVTSKHDTNVFSVVKIKLINNKDQIDNMPTCSITTNKNQITKDETFSIKVNCSSNNNDIKYNNKNLIYNEKYLKLISVKNNNENDLSFEYIFKPLKEGDISITIPQDYALSNETGNFMKSLIISIINNNKDNDPKDKNDSDNNKDNDPEDKNDNDNNKDDDTNKNDDNNNEDNRDNEKDNIGPTITYSLKGGTYNTTKTVTVNVSDTASGVKEFGINVYKNGVKDETRSISKITNKTSHSINLGGDGTWRIETYAFDNAGNKNKGDSLTNAGWYYQIYVISTNDSSLCSFKKLDNQYIKIGETTTYTLSCIDKNGFKDSDISNSDFIINTTGIVNITKITKKSITNGFTYLIDVKGLKTGKTTISLKSNSVITKNNTKNSTTTSSTIAVDSTSPTIAYSLKGGTYNTTKTVTVNVSDTTSGVREFGINVYKNGVKDERRSTSKITNKTSHSINLGGDGTWRIETYAFDNAGNKNKGDSLTNAGWYYQTYTINTTKNNNYIHFIKLGASSAGDAILLQSNDKFALIDTGYNTTTTKVINYLKAVGVKRLEFLLITHFDGDHMGGAKEILKNIPTNTLYIKTLNPNFNNSASSISLFDQIVSIANSKSTKVIYAETLGSTYNLTMEKMKIKFYNLNTYSSHYRNAESIITYIKIDNTKTLLTGDAISPYNNDVLNGIASEVGYNIDVYKMPHHGSSGCAIIRSFIPSNVVVTNYSKDVRAECISQYTNTKYYYTEDNPYSLVVEYDKDSVRLFRNKIGT